MIYLTETEKIFKAQIEHESYMRSLMDDFSFVDAVLSERSNLNKNGGDNDGN
jgi:hypothetical protein